MQKSKTLLSLLSLGSLAVVLGLAAPARAQTDAPAAAPPPAASSSSGFSGGGAGIGVGASAWLSGLTGAEVVYDASAFHVGGLIGFQSVGGMGMGGARTTSIRIGASGWYHLHRGASSDFSAGGGIGFADASGGGVTVQAFDIEPGVMARIFPTSNVAFHARVGLVLAFGDNGTAVGNTSSVALNGQVTGALGFTYFFR